MAVYLDYREKKEIDRSKMIYATANILEIPPVVVSSSQMALIPVGCGF